MNRRELVAPEGGQRVDRALASWCPDLSRSRIRALILAGLVKVNGEPVRPSQRLRAGDRVEVVVPPPRPPDLAPEDIPIRVVYEDDDLLVVDKPAGMPVHPGPGHPSATLVNALLARVGGLSTIGGVFRPGIVHRLDKDTSGLMVVAKNDAAHLALAGQFQRREMRKAYLALVWGHPNPPEGVIEAPIGRDPRHRQRMAVAPGGKPARTRFRTLARLGPFALLEVYPETGRTHQVRVHLAWLGHPIAGDAVYSRRRTDLVPRLFLHAHRLGFRLPSTGQWVEFTSPLPEELERALEALEAPTP